MDIGDKHGRWTVLSEPFKEGKYKKVCVRCDCGTEKSVRVCHLQSRASESCGCLKRERSSQAHKTHGMSESRLYHVWEKMIQRCTNPHSHVYDYYGGRGIQVCDEWRNSFEAFRLWAKSAGYAPHLTVDRINTESGYCPENCRFVTRAVQSENRRKHKNNRSGYIGVDQHRHSRYRARANRGGRTIHLGIFSDPIEAAKVRDAFVSKHYESPTLNF